MPPGKQPRHAGVDMIRYFAFGSNTNRSEIAHLAPQDLGPGVLWDYRLRLNYWSISRQGGACNIEPALGSKVHGRVWGISPSRLQGLHAKEGAPYFYRPIMVTLPTHGRCLTYEVTERHVLDFDLVPSVEYLNSVLDGYMAGHVPLGQIMNLLEDAWKQPEPEPPWYSYTDLYEEASDWLTF